VNLQTQQFEIHKQNEDRERDKQDRKRSEREANENVERQLLIAYISALESLRQSAEQRMQPQSIGRKTHAQLHSIVVQARVMTALSQVTKMCERRIRQVSYENRDERIVSIGDIDVPGAWHWKLGKLWEIYDASIEEVEKLTGRSSDGKLVKSVCGAIHFHLRKLRAIEVHFTEKRRRAIADIFAKMPSKEAIGEILGEDAASAAARKTAAGYMAACVADLGDLIEDTSIDERHVEL
ncbi:MAG TPA: hypothetical protein VGE52_08530, partial [Pirellulales bacterium]